MGQPVRKVIQQQHPGVGNKPIYTLLIDGTNLLRISFADTRCNPDGIHYGGIFQFLLQMKIMLKKKDYDYIYVVFDDEESGILRYQLYNEYKANRDKHYAKSVEENVSDYWASFEKNVEKREKYIYAKQKEEKIKKEAKKYKENGEINTLSEEFLDLNFARERDILMDCLSELFIRWIFNDKTEGDDIIAYYVNHKKPEEKIVIMSSDEDLTQLISDTVCIYNPRLKKFFTKETFKTEKGYPNENVVIKKIFLGDESDNIGKIDGLSETKLFEMMPEMKERPVTIEEVKLRAQELIDERIKSKKKPLKYCENIINGISKRFYDGDFYDINDKIINLKKPLLTSDAEEELKAMMYSPIDPEGRSFENLYQIILENKITDLYDNHFSSFFIEFKAVIEREKKRYEEWLKKQEK